MNRIGIYVFSGTGNTLKCAEALKEALDQKGVICGFHEIRDGETYHEEKDLILCYPIHGFNAPNVMLRFCRDRTDTLLTLYSCTSARTRRNAKERARDARQPLAIRAP